MEKKEKTIKQKSLWQEIWKNKAIYLIMLPGIIWFIVFSYGPMSGLQLAFKTYSMKRGIWGSPWCGLENFQYVFRDPSFLKSVGTTLWINAGRLIFQFPIPIILALLMNELRMKRYKKVVQTVLTFPHFLSWVMGLYKEVSSVLAVNKAQRHIRGGMATKRKYEAQKK